MPAIKRSAPLCAKVTRADVYRGARKYLDPANIVIAVAGPMKVIQDNASAGERPLVTGR